MVDGPGGPSTPVLAHVAHYLRSARRSPGLELIIGAANASGMAALEPGRGIDHEREVAACLSWEAVLAEALDSG